MKYKAIIFDMDGTIINTETIWRSATDHLLKQNNINLSTTEYNNLHHKVSGLATYKICEIIKSLGNLDISVEELFKSKSNLASNLFESGITFIDGFTDFHKKVINYNLKTGVATNADDRTLEITKRKMELEKFFGEHIYNISCVNGICKPDPDIYLYAADKLKVSPKECIAIEDSCNGVAAAKNAGMFCIGINTSKNLQQVKEADIIIDSYDNIELQNLIF